MRQFATNDRAIRRPRRPGEDVGPGLPELCLKLRSSVWGACGHAGAVSGNAAASQRRDSASMHIVRAARPTSTARIDCAGPKGLSYKPPLALKGSLSQPCEGLGGTKTLKSIIANPAREAGRVSIDSELSPLAGILRCLGPWGGRKGKSTDTWHHVSQAQATTRRSSRERFARPAQGLASFVLLCSY